MKSSRGFSLVELLVVIGIVALLAAILFPVLGRAKGAAYRTSCASNLRQIGKATLLYSHDYDDRLPPALPPQPTEPHQSRNVLLPYIQSVQVFRCPADNFTQQDEMGQSYDSQFSLNGTSYLLLFSGRPISRLRPTEPMAQDLWNLHEERRFNEVGPDHWKANAVFSDGSVKYVSNTYLQTGITE